MSVERTLTLTHIWTKRARTISKLAISELQQVWKRGKATIRFDSNRENEADPTSTNKQSHNK